MNKKSYIIPSKTNNKNMERYLHKKLSGAEVIKFTEQELTEEQKEQARENIGAADESSVIKSTIQTLTSEQKAQARENIDVLSITEIFEYLQHLGIDASYKDYMEWFYSENPLKRPLTIEAIFDNTYISLSNSNKYSDNSVAEPISILYSTDEGITWNTATTGGNICKLNAGERVLLKGNNACYDGHRFYPEPVYIYGNVMSLIQEENFDNITEVSEYCFAGLFLGFEDGGVESKSGYQIYLPATTLAKGCYKEMFKYTLLEEAPELPATTLADECYEGMFQSNNVITKTPELPATTLAISCYENMFTGCTALIYAQKILPATVLATRCYYAMFGNCTSLKETPFLENASFNNGTQCYARMFYNCSSLEKITLGFKYNPVDYQPQFSYTFYAINMPTNGTLIVRVSVNTKPNNLQLPSWKLEYYNALILDFETDAKFKLNTTSYSYNLNGNSWISSSAQINVSSGDKIYIRSRSSTLSISSSGIFNIAVKNSDEEYDNIRYKISGDIASIFNSAAELQTNRKYSAKNFLNGSNLNRDALISVSELRLLPESNMNNECYNNLFSNCIKLADAPKLPAINLSKNCYESMFEGCISLTSAPELPAKTLTAYCYKSMFAGCTSLSYVKALFNDIMYTTSVQGWLDNVSPTGTYVKSKDAVYNPVQTAGVPAGWTIETEVEHSSDEDVTTEVSTARKFWTGSSEKYAQLTPSNDTIYFITP